MAWSAKCLAGLGAARESLRAFGQLPCCWALTSGALGNSSQQSGGWSYHLRQFLGIWEWEGR